MFLFDEQGDVFKKLKPIYNKIVGNDRLKLASEETSLPNISFLSLSRKLNIKNNVNIQEAFSYTNSIANLNNSNNIRDLEQKFNETLALYKSTYKMYLEDIQQQTNKSIQQYLKTNIQDSKGNKYYINNFGYLRQYNGNSWDKKDSSCPSNISNISNTNIDDLVANLKMGVPMIQGLPCNLEGKVIENTDTVKIKAYIDKEGKKHLISNSEIYKNIISKGNCPSGVSATISSTIFNQIPSGLPLNNSNDSCFTNDSNSKLWNKVVQLNDKLINIVKQIYNEINELEKKDINIQNNLSKEKIALLDNISKLQKERKQMDIQDKRFTSLQGEYQNISLLNDSLYYQYIMWSIISLSLGYFIYRNMK